MAGPVLLEIRNRRGLHARASAKFVTLATQFDATVTVSKDGADVLGTSIMGLMMLAAATGDFIEVRAEGADAETALSALVELVEGKFGEE
ncbi:HPr family phosphocarrier protein [Sandaracinobacter sp. RS1-74]|uniref:HPr family phosphocarrier protein n=1 Tax=Sandaracinobacteroides sayramensis TaxID=2913411 RepID=UPI001EDC457A|nr:HPr family phosphocarrier protein [Sandaracinobacteroides sayramensis]MCG2839982.1 HPr family phosphocarrier protein [Sandaracinobacteroides sayramensis]